MNLKIAKLLIFTFIGLFCATIFSTRSYTQEIADSSADTENSDPLNQYLTDNNVYQGKDFVKAVTSGRLFFKGRQFKQARKKFEQAHALSPEHPIPYFFIGHTFFGNGDFQQALNFILRGFNIFYDWIYIDFNLRNEYRFPEFFDTQKAKLLENALNETDPNLWFLLGYFDYYSNSLEPSVEAFRETLRLLKEKSVNNSIKKITQDYMKVLVQRGIVNKVDNPAEELIIPTWQKNIIDLMGNNNFAKCAVLSGDEAIKANNTEAFFWMSIFLIADERFDLAWSMFVRGLRIEHHKVQLVPAISDMFSREDFETFTKKAKSTKSQLLLAFLQGNLKKVRDTLSGNSRSFFSEEEANLILTALPFREVLPAFDAFKNTTSKPDETKPPDVIKNPPDETTKPVEVPDTPTAEEIAKAEKLRVNQLKTKFAAAQLEGEADFKKEDFNKAAKDFLVGLSYAQQISEEFATSVENSIIYLQLARSFFGALKFPQASLNLQLYLRIAKAETRKSVKFFEQPYKSETFKALFTTLDQHCTLSDNDPDSIFLLAYLFFSQGNYQLAVDYFTDSLLLKPNELATWYIKTLAEVPYKVKATNDAATKALYALEKAQKYLSKQHYETAQIEFKRAYNNLSGLDNFKAISGLLVCLFQAASQAISVQDRADFYSNCADYLRRYLKSIGDGAWKEFKIDIAGTFPSKDDYSEAKKALKEHTKDRMLDFEAHYFQAFVYYFEKKYLDALNSFKKYLNTMNRANNAEVHYFMAACKNP